MASGLPVIVPDYGGPRELVNQNTGFKIPLGNKDNFLKAHIKVMEDIALSPELRQRLSIEARKFIINKYSWESKANKLLEIYKNILLK